MNARLRSVSLRSVSLRSISLCASLFLLGAISTAPVLAQSVDGVIAPGDSSNGSVSQGNWRRYSVDNSAGLDSTSARLSGLTGDVDLYVQYGRLPTQTDYACRSWAGGTTAESCNIDFGSGETAYVGVYGYRSGAFTLSIAAGDGGDPGNNIGQRNGRIEWEGWNLDYDTFALSDGLTIHDVSFEGTPILDSASFPVMSVYYANNACGPYADRLNGPQAQVTWADNALLVAREFTQDGKQWFELGIREFIGSYDIYQVWYLSADGELDGHVFSRGLQCNFDHVHYPMWRFDFDIDGTGNDRILRETSAGQLTPYTTEFETEATAAFQHGWFVEDTQSGYRVRVDFDDGGRSVGDGRVVPASNYENNRVSGVAYRDSEQGWTGGASRNLPYDNGESLTGGDAVLWYRGYLPHTPAEGSALWHSTGVRITTDANETSECGSPNVDPATEGGVHFWKECDGPWTLLLTGSPGTGSIKATGKIGSELGIVGLAPVSIESSDTLSDANPQQVVFDLTTGNPWSDRFLFDTLDGDELCLGFDRITASEQLYIGPDRIPAGTGPVNPVTLESCEFSGPDCSAPDYDPATDRALITWVDCAGVLHLVGTSGQPFSRYSGHVYASSSFVGTDTRSFESSDTLTNVSASDVFFEMGMGGGYADEILLTPANGADMCVDISAQGAGTVLLAGADRTPVTSPFNPLTLQSCQPPAGSDDCGNPQVDSASDSAFFVWKNCDGSWSVALTGVRPDGGGVRVTGSITSSADFDVIEPAGLESSDSLSTSPASPLTFEMGTNNPWKDGFNFEVPAGASLCVTLDSVSDGLDILAGPDRTPVGTSFNPETFAGCP